MFEARKKRKERALRIEKLRAEIDSVYQHELRDANTRELREEEHQRIDAQVMVEQNQLEYLEQEDLLAKVKAAGVTIPQEFWGGEEWPLEPTLSDEGERWPMQGDATASPFRYLTTYRERHQSASPGFSPALKSRGNLW